MAAKGVLSVVVPVFRNEGSLVQTHERISDVHRRLLTGMDLEVVFVDDGSDDGSWEVLQSIREGDPSRVTLVKLSRNFGQVNAIMAGLDAARGDCVATLSADLQDPAELLADMVQAWSEGVEVVIAHRTGRQDDAVARAFSRIAYGVARRANPRMPDGGFDYVLLSRRAADLLCSFSSRHRFFQGDVLWLGLSTKLIPYVREQRTHGKSTWTFGKKFKYFTDLVLDSSYVPIQLMSRLGMLVAFGGFGYALVITLAWFWKQTPFPGYAPIMVTLLILGGLIMIMLGIIGEYLWRIFDDVKGKPPYVIERRVSAGEPSDEPGLR